MKSCCSSTDVEENESASNVTAEHSPTDTENLCCKYNRTFPLIRRVGSLAWFYWLQKSERIQWTVLIIADLEFWLSFQIWATCLESQTRYIRISFDHSMHMHMFFLPHQDIYTLKSIASVLLAIGIHNLFMYRENDY